MLKKADILEGANKCQEVEIEALEGKVVIRKLGDGELAKVQSIMASGGKMGGSGKGDDPDDVSVNVELDAEAAITNTRRAKHTAISLALTNDETGEEWAPKEVAALPPDAVNELAKEVIEYAGASKMKTFRRW